MLHPKLITYMEQRVVILSNAAKLVEKSIEVDKDILVDIAKYRSGIFLKNLEVM